MVTEGGRHVIAADPIEIAVEDELPAVIERIRRSPADDVQLLLPPRSRFGQSRFNFQLLRQYCTRLGKRAAIATPDPVVQKLAEESGFGAIRLAGPADGAVPDMPASGWGQPGIDGGEPPDVRAWPPAPGFVPIAPPTGTAAA